MFYLIHFPNEFLEAVFLIQQINGFNKHALNSNKSKLYNTYV